MDLYAAQLRLDMAYRREWCERAGLGNGARELVWDLSWANWATNWVLQFARHSSRKPALRHRRRSIRLQQIEFIKSDSLTPPVLQTYTLRSLTIYVPAISLT